MFIMKDKRFAIDLSDSILNIEHPIFKSFPFKYHANSGT